MFVKGTFFKNYRGRKITRIETNGERFTVKFSDGEVLQNLNITELNHIIVTATGR